MSALPYKVTKHDDKISAEYKFDSMEHSMIKWKQFVSLPW